MITHCLKSPICVLTRGSLQSAQLGTKTLFFYGQMRGKDKLIRGPFIPEGRSHSLDHCYIDTHLVRPTIPATLSAAKPLDLPVNLWQYDIGEVPTSDCPSMHAKSYASRDLVRKICDRATTGIGSQIERCRSLGIVHCAHLVVDFEKRPTRILPHQIVESGQQPQIMSAIHVSTKPNSSQTS